MVWTGVEAKDVADLRPKHFKMIKGQEWLIKERHKTMLTNSTPLIKIPVLPQFRKILDEVPIPLNKDMPYFPDLDCDACNQAIGDIFYESGAEGLWCKVSQKTFS